MKFWESMVVVHRFHYRGSTHQRTPRMEEPFMKGDAAFFGTWRASGSQLWATLSQQWSTLGYSGQLFPATWLSRYNLLYCPGGPNSPKYLISLDSWPHSKYHLPYKGPSTQCLRTLVTKNHTLHGFWDQSPKFLGTWTLWVSDTWIPKRLGSTCKRNAWLQLTIRL